MKKDLSQNLGKEKDFFRDLYFLLSEQKYQEAQAQLTRANIITKTFLQQQLLDYIIKENTYFFSISTNGFLPVQEIENKMTASQVLILSNLSLKNQLKLMNWSLEVRDLLCVEHFKCLKIKKFELLSDWEKSALVDLAVASLNKEDFESLNYIEKNIYSDIFTLSNNYLSFYYEEKYCRGNSNTKLSFPIAVNYNMFINFSVKKIEYFLEKNLPLIEPCVIEEFLSKLDSSQNNFNFKIELLKERIDAYISHREKILLTDKLPVNITRNKLIKI